WRNFNNPQYIDIDWSPYFPIVSGVFTEIGGFISHGAVISREYGIPCIVGLQGATKKFRTGPIAYIRGGQPAARIFEYFSDPPPPLPVKEGSLSPNSKPLNSDPDCAPELPKRPHLKSAVDVLES
ncbi:phosphoenolpyruvate synthase, partial [Caerostris extrusa]